MSGWLASGPKMPVHGQGHSVNKIWEVSVLGSGRCAARAWGLVLLMASDGDKDLMSSKQELIVESRIS